jgi:hypothetical protein
MARLKRIETAKFVDWVSVHDEDLVNDAKAFTWSSMREHAVVRLRGGRYALVHGGSHGISFVVRPSGFIDPFGNPLEAPCVVVDSQPIAVDQLVFQTHPFPTGPSDSDFEMLELLNQDGSIIYEIRGAEEGTTFRRRSKS